MRGCVAGAPLPRTAGGSLPGGGFLGCPWGEGTSQKRECGSRAGGVLPPRESGGGGSGRAVAAGPPRVGWTRFAAPGVQETCVAPACVETAGPAAHGAKDAGASRESLSQSSPPASPHLCGRRKRGAGLYAPQRGHPCPSSAAAPRSPCPRVVPCRRSPERGRAAPPPPSWGLSWPTVPPAADPSAAGGMDTVSSVTRVPGTGTGGPAALGESRGRPQCRRCPRKTALPPLLPQRAGPTGREGAAGRHRGPGGAGVPTGAGGWFVPQGITRGRGVPAPAPLPRGVPAARRGGARGAVPLASAGCCDTAGPMSAHQLTPGPGTASLYGARRPRGAALIAI